MKKLMLTSAVTALLLGRAWITAQEPAAQPLPQQGQTVIQEARGKTVPTTASGYAEVVVDSGSSERKHTSLAEGRATAVAGNVVQSADEVTRELWGNATHVMGILVQPVPAALAAQLPMLGGQAQERTGTAT